MLKEEVRVMLCELIDHVHQLDMIDVLERLGVSDHFNNEIRSILESVHNNIQMLKRKKDLYSTALAFRLLRQHGFNISTGINLHWTGYTLTLHSETSILLLSSETITRLNEWH